MTARERKVWLLVGGVLIAALIYNIGFRSAELPQVDEGFGVGLQEAQRLLRAEHNIAKRSQAVNERMRLLEQKFYQKSQLAEAELELLGEVEDIAFQSGLTIRRKNTAQFSDEELGVSLEGTTQPQELFRFLQQLTTAPVELKIKRLQLHVVPGQKVLDYQIAVSTILVE